MAFQTGLASDSAALVSIIKSFCVSNGWTLLGNVLLKGNSNVRLTSTDTAQGVMVEGANSADFLATPCPQYARAYISSSYWPVTYFLFAKDSPDTVVCILQYNSNYFEWLAFGNAITMGGYTGGNWFAASHQWNGPLATASIGTGGLTYIHQSIVGSGALFWKAGGVQYLARNSYLHAEIDGYIWPGANDTINDKAPAFADYAYPLHTRSPNAWNSQAVLTPFWLFFQRPSGFISLIAELGWVRSLRIDNYNPGDVIALGPDRWMVFPWVYKNAAYRDGPPENISQAGLPGESGTWGWAIFYDGP